MLNGQEKALRERIDKMLADGLIVDAARSGSAAGAIFKVPGRELETEAEVRFGLHDFRWQHALAAGRKIFGADFPSEVTVFLIEADSLDFGLELSAPVLTAALRVVEEIQDMIRAYSHPGGRRDPE